MNASHLHLVVNHLPFATFAFAFIGLLVGLVSRSAAIKRFSLSTLVVAGLLGAVTFYSGKAANEASFGNDSPFRTEVARHEKSAQTTWIIGIVVAGLALVVVLTTRKMNDVPPSAMIACTVATAICLVFFLKTSNLGGQIRHPEIRADSLTKLINPRD